ncbi:phosphodiesterase [Prevotella sp.]|uniref:phosphodiesterase n=1 Tax=Prevotella sp. TaxID=59823 RepID=UPI0040282466
MKYLLVSDIHGCLPTLERVLQFFDQGKYDMLCILGDILNYGPRNRIPEGIDPKGIVERLNAMKERIIAIRGNCDAEVDQMLLQFPIMADYALVVDNGRRLFLTHGHVYNEQNCPTLAHDIFVYGHTHLWKLEQTDEGDIVCNIGSITFPKGGNEPTFATYEDGQLIIRHLDGSIMKTLSTTHK